jgi:hypothetical protein
LKHWPHSVQIPCLNFFFLFLSFCFRLMWGWFPQNNWYPH